MARHSVSATPEQIDTLLNFLDQHRDLARGKLRSVETRFQAKRLWEEVSNKLNSMGGGTKTIQQWQKVWFDRKHLAKKAAAESRRYASQNGGGPAIAHPLSQWELKVLSIMGDEFSERQTGANVLASNEINESIPSPSSEESQPSSFTQPIDFDWPKEVVVYVEPTIREPTPPPRPGSQVHVSQETKSSQPKRLRRRPAPGSNARSRLFRLEEQRAERETVRNNELAGIKVALLQLCGLVRECLDRAN